MKGVASITIGSLASFSRRQEVRPLPFSPPGKLFPPAAVVNVSKRDAAAAAVVAVVVVIVAVLLLTAAFSSCSGIFVCSNRGSDEA